MAFERKTIKYPFFSILYQKYCACILDCYEPIRLQNAAQSNRGYLAVGTRRIRHPRAWGNGSW